ncbi:LamG-like jellyroll fold domain-containing protein [Pseudarthrobacter sp. L19]|uniref:LamG-like jellyroll fold domain-containing protein n=1 Tax=Pseudarthrobacter sp. L19 TaxID=3423951 RepID=UPI003D79D121
MRALLVLASLPVLIAPELLLATPAHAAFSAVAAPGTGSFAAAENYDCLDPTVGFGPTLFYPFNEAAGATAVDFSGNRRNGVLGAGAARVVGSCAPGDSPALDLSSPGAMVGTPQIVDAPTTFSLAVWFRAVPGATPGGRLLGFGDAQTGASAQSDRHLYMTNTGGIGLGVITRNGQSDQYKAESVVAAGPFNDGRWHLAVGTLDPVQGAALYVDGVLMMSGKNIVAERPYKGFWRVGYDSMDVNTKKDWPGAPTDVSFRGAVDNAAVYAAVLSPAQVQSLYTGGR